MARALKQWLLIKDIFIILVTLVDVISVFLFFFTVQSLFGISVGMSVGYIVYIQIFLFLLCFHVYCILIHIGYKKRSFRRAILNLSIRFQDVIDWRKKSWADMLGEGVRSSRTHSKDSSGMKNNYIICNIGSGTLRW